MARHAHGGNIYEQHIELDFSANINFLGMPQKVLEAAIEGTKEAKAYPEPYSKCLKQALAKRYGIQENRVVCGNGASDILFALLQTLRPKRAAIFTPCFQEYEQALESLKDCKIIKIPLERENGFALDKKVANKLTEAAGDVIILSLPNNPTGICPTGEAMAQMMEWAHKHHTTLILDLCFWEFVDSKVREKVLPKQMLQEFFSEVDEHQKSGRKEQAGKRDATLFFINAFTKTYAMPGLRLGFGISADAALIERVENHMQPWSVSLPAQKAGLAACQEKEFLTQSRLAISGERQFLTGELRKLGFGVYPGEANFLFFSGKPGLKEYLVNHGILIRDLSNFEGLQAGDYRICVRSHSENEKLIERIKSWQK